MELNTWILFEIITTVIVVVVIIIVVIIVWKVVFRILDGMAQPLTEEQLKICEQVVKDGKAMPFICKRALKKEKCPFLPCIRLETARKT